MVLKNELWGARILRDKVEDMSEELALVSTLYVNSVAVKRTVERVREEMKKEIEKMNEREEGGYRVKLYTPPNYWKGVFDNIDTSGWQSSERDEIRAVIRNRMRYKVGITEDMVQHYESNMETYRKVIRYYESEIEPRFETPWAGVRVRLIIEDIRSRATIWGDDLQGVALKTISRLSDDTWDWITVIDSVAIFDLCREIEAIFMVERL